MSTQFMSVNGVRLAYDEAGSGPPLLLIHAGIADRRMWDDTQVAFTDRYRVIRPDLRGYGETPLPDGRFVNAADMAELLRRLDVPRAHVIGVSMGGSVGMDLALAHPELVDRLVLVAPGLSGWEWGEEAQAGFAAEEAAVEAGDLDEASWVAVRTWLDGPLRGPEVVDSTLRSRVFDIKALGSQGPAPDAHPVT
jgi:pimeloyl-ACP methyl ester carboxylesterase